MTVPVPVQLPNSVQSIDALNTITNTTNGAQSPAASPSAFTFGATGERTFTADEMAKARKEEKDKLYPELDAMKKQWAEAQKTLEEIKVQRQAELDEIARKQQEKEAALQAKKEDEMSAKALMEQRLSETQREFEEKIAAIQAERDQERVLREKERAYNELVDYRTAALTQAGQTVAPQFYDFIQGETQDQIDAAIARAQQSTKSILDEVTQAQRTPQPRGVSPTGYTVSGPLDSLTGTKQYTNEDINNMSMAEYAEFRQKSGIASGEAQRNRGLFN